jgi:hypothetical protein
VTHLHRFCQLHADSSGFATLSHYASLQASPAASRTAKGAVLSSTSEASSTFATLFSVSALGLLSSGCGYHPTILVSVRPFSLAFSYLLLPRSETYANAAYTGNTISNYFLCMLNGSSIIGATLYVPLLPHHPSQLTHPQRRFPRRPHRPPQPSLSHYSRLRLSSPLPLVAQQLHGHARSLRLPLRFCQ